MKEQSQWSASHWGAAVAIGIALCAAVMGASWFWLGAQLPGYFNDDWSNGIYLHHQVHAALMDGRFDLSDPNQFFPFGYNPVHTNGGNVLEMLVSGLCRLVFAWPLWLSVAALAWIPLNLLAFVPLGRRLWHRPSTVLAASATWAIFPPVLEQIGAGRLTQAALVGVPLMFAGLLDVADPKRSCRGGLAAFGWVLVGLGYWYNAFFLGLLMPVAWWGLRTPGHGKALALALCRVGGLALLGVAPFLTVVFWPWLSGDGMPGSHIDPTQMSLVFPDALRLVGGQGRGMANWLPFSMGIGVLLFVRWGRRRALWGGLALLTVVFSMGPGQAIGGSVYPFPYWVLWKVVPGLAGMFHPDRWMLLAGLFLTVASVEGVVRKWPAAVWLIPLGVVVQLWVRGVAPLGTWAPTVPEHWMALANDPEPGAVIVVPMHQGQLASQFQRVHGRPLLGGMIEDQPWRHPAPWKSYVNGNDFLLSLKAISYGRDVPLVLDAESLSLLRNDGFTRIVYDHSSWMNSPRRTEHRPDEKLRAAFGPPLFESQTGAVWALSDSTTK